MSSAHRPFPDITRFPGEPKLVGVPHLKRESIFSEPGIVDALELVNETIGLSSSQRRPKIEAAIGHLARQPELAQDILLGLEKLTDASVLANPDKRLHSSFLRSILEPKLLDTEPASKHATEQPIHDVSPSVSGSWAMGLKDLPVEKYTGKQIDKDSYLLHQVGKLVAKNNVNDPENVELGVRLFNRYYDPEESLAQSISTVVKLGHAIDQAKVKVTSRSHTTEVSNIIISSVSAAFAGRLPLNPETAETIERAMTAFQEREFMGWSYVKMRMIENYYSQRREIAQFATRLGTFGKMLERFDGVLEINNLAELTEQAMHNLSEFRRYGIKDAYFRDGVMHCAEDSWVVEDADGFFDDVDFRVFNPQMAVISLAHAKKIDDIEGEKVRQETGRGSMILKQHEYEAHFVMGMLPDGELIIFGSYGVLPLREEFRAQGVESAYEIFKLSHINRLIDLVVPATLIAEQPSLKQDKGILGRLNNIRKLLNPPKLLVPRLRLLVENADLVNDELQKEAQEADQKTERQLRDHSVVGHIRVLPPGYKPTPQAQREAARLGIKLAPNETWVQKHRRGNKDIGEIKSYLAVKSKS